MTTVTVNTYTHSVVYVADNILKSLKDIIREVGLDPSKLMGDYETNMRALRSWLSSQDLRQVNLEIFDPDTDALITRWDLDIAYGWSPATYRSTAGMARQSLGSTIEHSGLGASAAYWRKT